LKYDPKLSGGSDHQSFINKEIPSVFFFSGLHRDYHKIGDSVDKINCNQVAKVSKCALLMLYELANQEEKLKFSDGKPKHYKKSRRLGIMRDSKRVQLKTLEGYGFENDQGAVRVKSVFPDSAAAKAGVQSGDLILCIDRIRISNNKPISSLDKAINLAPANVEIAIEVLRKQKIVMLKILWKE